MERANNNNFIISCSETIQYTIGNIQWFTKTILCFWLLRNIIVTKLSVINFLDNKLLTLSRRTSFVALMK